MNLCLIHISTQRRGAHPGSGLFRSVLAGLLILALAGCGGRREEDPLALTLLPPASPMPLRGSSVLFRAEVSGGRDPRLQWWKDGLPLSGARGETLVLPAVSAGDAGAYRVQAEDVTGTLQSEAFVLEPVDAALVVRSAGDHGPGTLREALTRLRDFEGTGGVLFSVPGEGPLVIQLERDLEPITGKVCILGPAERPLILDGGGRCRPFFLDGGTLILDRFTVAHGLGKGGEGLGGGGGAAGMGGALFINRGTADLRRMRFLENLAQGGGSAPGGDGESGGGGGFGGDSPLQGGLGAGGGFLGGRGGFGHLDGTQSGGGPAYNEEGASGGGGGGAARGGTLDLPAAQWLSDNLPGGAGNWGGGGGFSVGPEGGGGAAGVFGGGGGGSGGCALLAGGLPFGFPGSAKGDAGVFGGEGGMGDGVRGGRGGGGGGLGGAIFLREGSLPMLECEFIRNRALPGLGAEDGLGKGGAIFVHAYDEAAPFPMETLKAQKYQGNEAPDLAEDPAWDNADWYVAQRTLIRKVGSSMDLLYRLYRIERAMGWSPSTLRPGVPPQLR